MTPSARLLAVAAIATFAVVPSSSDAARAKDKSCGKLTVDGQTFSTKVQLVRAKQTPYSCALTRGVLRAFHRTDPSAGVPNTVIRYQGKKYSCYVIRDSSGYNCFSDNMKVRRGTMTGLFA